MEQLAQSNAVAPTFAGLLAALIKPRRQKGLSADGIFDSFQDDVVTLSYESALKTHGRYRRANTDTSGQDWDAAPAFGGPTTGELAHVAGPVSGSEPEATPSADATTVNPAGANAVEDKLARSRKRASVTLRMSKAECGQLQQRAAEAGMTVSAYLRACVFEVEDLRSQVKQAMAELRAAQPLKLGVSKQLSPWTRLFHRRRAALLGAGGGA